MIAPKFTANINISDRLKNVIDKRFFDRIVRRVVKRTTPFAAKKTAEVIAEDGNKRWNIRKSDLQAKMLDPRARKFGAVRQVISNKKGEITFSSISIGLVFFKPIVKTSSGALQIVSKGAGRSSGLTFKHRKRGFPSGATLSFEIIKGRKTVITNNKFFLATMKSGHTGIWLRQKEGKKWKIKEVRVITPVSMITQIGKRDVFVMDINKKVMKETQYAIDYYLNNLSKSE